MGMLARLITDDMFAAADIPLNQIDPAMIADVPQHYIDYLNHLASMACGVSGVYLLTNVHLGESKIAKSDAQWILRRDNLHTYLLDRQR